MEIKIEKMKIADLEEFWSVFSKLIRFDFPGYSRQVIDYFLTRVYSPANFRYWLQINWRPVLLAKVKEKIVGFAVLDKPYGGVSFLRWLGVVPEFRKKGIGKQLIKIWIKEAKTACCHKIELAGQREAKVFYEKAGFLLEGKRKLSYFGIDQFIFGMVIGKPDNEAMIKD